jgi:hypothetical protein
LHFVRHPLSGAELWDLNAGPDYEPNIGESRSPDRLRANIAEPRAVHKKLKAGRYRRPDLGVFFYLFIFNYL